jgi:hypothetical protein
MELRHQESGLQLLHDLLGLFSSLRPESPKYCPPIFISIPNLREKKPELPLKLTILDLLDLPHLSPCKVLTTHTFIKKVPHCWTQSTTSPSPHKSKPVFVTKNILSLEQLLPRNRDLVFVSNAIEPNLRDILTVLRSLGLSSKMHVVGIFDIEMLAREIASQGGRGIFRWTLQRLQCPMDSFENDTEVMLRVLLLLALESCKNDCVDSNGKAWLDCIKAVGMMSMRSTVSPMDVVRKEAEKVGKAIIGGVMRSIEEIEKIREERRARRQEVKGGEEYVTEIRLWDGMWELL